MSSKHFANTESMHRIVKPQSSQSSPRPRRPARSRPLIATIIGLSASSLFAQEKPKAPVDDSPQTLGKTVVTGQIESVTAPSLETATSALSEVAGSVSLVSSEVFEKGRVGTAADILAFQPGVFAQSTGGQDALRISIRGSGINRGQGSFREGIHFLFDGLPLTGTGGSPYELFEPLGVSYTEILRGGNALLYGGIALGGAINYVSKTGYDASPAEVRLELGSFGYRKAQVASGGVHGNKDYYVTLIGSEREGFQNLTEGYSARAIANFGVKFNDRISTRVYARFGATGFENAGNLTLAQLKADPTQANPVNVAQATVPRATNYRLQQGSTWIGSKTIFRPDADRTIEIGAVVHDYPIDIQGSTVRSLWEHDDLALSARYISTKPVLGNDNTFTAGFQTSTTLKGEVTSYTDNFLTLKTQTRKYDGSGNYVFYAQDEHFLTKQVALSAAALLAYVHREAEYTYLNNNPLHPEYDRDVLRFAPRVGIRYEPTANWSFFGNVSRAVEPADNWKYNAIRNANIAVQTVEAWTDLREQIADTVEVGTRAKFGRFDGSLTVYRTWLKEELLTVVDPTNPNLRINTNASPTIHQGIEAALTTVLWQNAPLTSKKADHSLSLRQAYTFNDFHYRNDPVFKQNELPGLPRSFYQAELNYEHPSGVYASVNAQISSAYFVDYDDSFEAPSYTVYGAKIGYAPPKAKWEVYLDFRNLTDEAYAIAVTPAYTTRSVPTVGAGRDAAVFQPGDGFSVFGGISWKY